MAKKLNPQDELDMDQMAEAELSRLQRQYRIMEGDREAYSQETNSLLQKQRKMIVVLEKEKKELMTNLKLAQAPMNYKKDSLVEKNICQGLANGDKYDAEIRVEKAQLSELEAQIRKVEKEVIKLRLKDISDNQSQLIAINASRTIAILENRLYVATVKFNETLTGNSELREEIDHLLKERSHFNLLYQQLINRLNSGKKVMIDLIEQATLAYDQREEAQSKLLALKERGRQDLLGHSQEMRELQRKLDHDTKLQEFLGIKGQKRIMADLEAREALKKQMQREATERLIEKYQFILEQIRTFSGEENVDRLAARFIKQEEENFALFNYVNELNNELESLQDQVEELRGRIDDQRGLNRQRAQQQQFKLGVCREKLEKVRKEADDAQFRLLASNRTMNSLLEGIEQVFALIRCDSSPLLQLLGSNTHVTTYNVMLYLGIIERRTNELLRNVFYVQKMHILDEGEEYPAILKDVHLAKLRPKPLDKMAPSHPCALCVEQEEFSGMSEAPVFPQTREETRQKLAERLELPNIEDRLHTVSLCRLPRSRRIMQRRYQ